MGDELFDLLEPELLEKTHGQTVVATDLARLLALSAVLNEGFERAVWIDADVLIVNPDRFDLPEGGALFGREVWVQEDEGHRLKVFRKIHNAFMACSRDDPVLPFYRFAATRILSRHQGPMVPQLIGPKLLTLLHNAIGFDVLEEAGMLSPVVAKDLLAGGGPALDRFRTASQVTPLAVNLCGSLVVAGEMDDQAMARLVKRLTDDRELLEGC